MLKLISATLCAGLLGSVVMVQPAEARRLHFWWEQDQPEYVPSDSYTAPNYDDGQDADVAEQFNQDQYDRYMREMKHPKRKRVIDAYYEPQVQTPSFKKTQPYKLKKPVAKVSDAKPVVKAPVATANPDKPVQVASLANRLSDKVQPKKIDCTKGASIVSGYGFSGVTSKTCAGDTLTYAATRSGKNFEIQVNAANGELTNVKRL
jgi:hypothetical protein